MAVLKLSQIAASTANIGSSNSIVGIYGSSDVLFTQTQLTSVSAILQIDKGSVGGGGTVTFDASQSSKQKLTVASSLTIAYSNWPASGTYGEVEVMLVNGGSAALAWPTINWLKGDGTQSTTFSNMGVTLYSTAANFVIVWTVDGGTTLYGRAA